MQGVDSVLEHGLEATDDKTKGKKEESSVSFDCVRGWSRGAARDEVGDWE